MFQVESGDTLSLTCFRRVDQSGDAFSDGFWKVGTFVLDDCHAKIETIAADFSDLDPNRPPLTLAELSHPEWSHVAFEGYAELPINNSLTFVGAGASQKPYELFAKTPLPYFVVPPAEKHEPTTTHVYYPFAYRDKQRTYVAHAVRGAARPAKHVPIDLQYGLADDAAISKIKGLLPDGVFATQTGMSVDKLLVVGGGTTPGVIARHNGIAVPFGLANAVAMSGQTTTVSSSAAAGTLAMAQVTARGADYVRFHTAFHPHVCKLVEALDRDGIAGVLATENQLLTNDLSPALPQFLTQYYPTGRVDKPYPREDIDFGSGAYSTYNWELFFHIPLLVAQALSSDRQFEAAQRWLHYIFDPTAANGTVESYWKFVPFKLNASADQQIAKLLAALAPGGDPVTRKQVLDQIEAWRDNPFDPHLLARLRVTSYQKTVVIKYVENLIAWGDQLFARDTIEAMNEATQLYVLASHILGRRPETAPPRGDTDAKCYAELKPDLDRFSNAMVDLENTFPFSSEDAVGPGSPGAAVDLGVAKAFYFCIPGNEQLDALWDTVADRLFKIRHCMNLQGVVRQLPLFEPPIDPALLVKATALGLDIGAILDNVSSPLAPYRFTTLLQKANEMCGEVRAFGGSLLAALEKKDGEALAALRAGHETALLRAIQDIKKRQLDEAKTNVEALERTQDVTTARQTYYQGLLTLGVNAMEQTQLLQLGEANQATLESIGYEQEAQGASQIPNATFGTSGTASSPVVTAQFGGSNLSAALSAYARYLSGTASTAAYTANSSSIMAGHARRAEEWEQQVTLATKELAQIERQLAAANIRVAIAEVDHDNQQLQIDNSEAYGELLRTKYTNQELYTWMQSQLGALYFQLYGLAYDLAKKAEKAYRYELGLASSSFVQFGHWDSLHKGLLAGDRLGLDLKRMEAAYLDQNRRELEIAKDVSLLQLDAAQLLALRETGACDISLPETLFDGDYPGHYMRRVKSVGLTIPCVTGPYTSVNCTLTLLASKVRTDPNAQRPYPEDASKPDPRFASSFGAVQSIATSHAQNDAGMFEVSFRDERYLPFEGAGAISTWRLELPRDCNAFDVRTISDVILHLHYTARDGGMPLRTKAKAARTAELANADAGLSRMFSARHEFPNDWHRFLHPLDTEQDLALVLDLGQIRFPFAYRDTSQTPKHNRIKITAMDLVVSLADAVPYANAQPGGIRLALARNQVVVGTVDLASPAPGRSPQALGVAVGSNAAPDTWSVRVSAADLAALAQHNPALCTTIVVDGAPRIRLEPEAIDDLWLICHYTVLP
jgi:hypothetical protein